MNDRTNLYGCPIRDDAQDLPSVRVKYTLECVRMRVSFNIISVAFKLLISAFVSAFCFVMSSADFSTFCRLRGRENLCDCDNGFFHSIIFSPVDKCNGMSVAANKF